MNPNDPRFFGFPEFISGMAIFLLIWTITDHRYKLRLKLQGFNGSFQLKILFTVGILCIITDIWRAVGLPLPPSPTRAYLHPALWQATLAFVYFATVLRWIYRSFFSRVSLGEDNKFSFLETLESTLSTGNSQEIRTLSEEISDCYLQIFHLSSNSTNSMSKELRDTAEKILFKLDSPRFVSEAYKDLLVVDRIASSYRNIILRKNQLFNGTNHEDLNPGSGGENSSTWHMKSMCESILFKCLMDRNHQLNREFYHFEHYGFEKSSIGRHAIQGLLMSMGDISKNFTGHHHLIGPSEQKILSNLSIESIKILLYSNDKKIEQTPENDNGDVRIFDGIRDQIGAVTQAYSEDFKFSNDYHINAASHLKKAAFEFERIKPRTPKDTYGAVRIFWGACDAILQHPTVSKNPSLYSGSLTALFFGSGSILGEVFNSMLGFHVRNLERFQSDRLLPVSGLEVKSVKFILSVLVNPMLLKPGESERLRDVLHAYSSKDIDRFLSHIRENHNGYLAYEKDGRIVVKFRDVTIMEKPIERTTENKFFEFLIEKTKNKISEWLKNR